MAMTFQFPFRRKFDLKEGDMVVVTEVSDERKRTVKKYRVKKVFENVFTALDINGKPDCFRNSDYISGQIRKC